MDDRYVRRGGVSGGYPLNPNSELFTYFDWRTGMLLWNQLKSHAAAQGHKRALVCEDTALTYAEFAARVENVAQAWLRRGLKPGDRIALHMRNGIDLATCYFACFAAGFVAVPINTRLTAAEIAYVLDHC